jgi:uncharacterized heparinase superfamily protein
VSLLEGSLDAIAEAVPACHAALRAALDGMSVGVTMGDDRLRATFTRDAVHLSRELTGADVEIRTTRQTVLEIVEDGLPLDVAVWNDAVAVQGTLDAVARVHEGLRIYTHGAVRTPKSAGLLARFREGARR